jgi:DNA-directed RNA polymerase specialized sigma24 family protein
MTDETTTSINQAILNYNRSLEFREKQKHFQLFWPWVQSVLHKKANHYNLQEAERDELELTLLEKLDKATIEDKNPQGWFHTTITNTCIDVTRKNKREKERFSSFEELIQERENLRFSPVYNHFSYTPEQVMEMQENGGLQKRFEAHWKSFVQEMAEGLRPSSRETFLSSISEMIRLALIEDYQQKVDERARIREETGVNDSKLSVRHKRHAERLQEFVQEHLRDWLERHETDIGLRELFERLFEYRLGTFRRRK